MPAVAETPVNPTGVAAPPGDGEQFRKHSGSVLSGVFGDVYTRLLQLAWRVLPDRLLLVLLAYNRLSHPAQGVT